MRKRIKPLALLLFFACFILYIVISKHHLDVQIKQAQTKKSQVSQVTNKKKKEEAPSDEPEEELLNKPIVDLSGWQQIFLVLSFACIVELKQKKKMLPLI